MPRKDPRRPKSLTQLTWKLCASGKAKTQLSTIRALKVTIICIKSPLAKARRLTGLGQEISDLDFTEQSRKVTVMG